jgi:hypothetical protein
MVVRGRILPRAFSTSDRLNLSIEYFLARRDPGATLRSVSPELVVSLRSQTRLYFGDKLRRLLDRALSSVTPRAILEALIPLLPRLIRIASRMLC